MRRRVQWAVAICVAAAAVLAAANLHGLSSRRRFEAPAELKGHSAALVGDALGAFRVWRGSGIRGRRLVVLTGRWSKPRNLEAHPPTPEELAAAGPDGEFLDADSALYAAARAGLVRRLDVVMPPAAFTHRLGEVSGTKGLEREGGAFRLPYNGLERRFSTPAGFVPPAEPVLVLVEPSWFGPGAPPDPLRWLADRGVTWDLALVALEDPSASGEERVAAASFGRAAGAPFLEAQE